MRMFLPVLCLILVSLRLLAAEVVNTQVRRTLDLSNPVVKLTSEITFEGAEGHYDLLVPLNQTEHLAFMTVKDKKDDSDLSFTKQKQERDFQVFRVTLKPTTESIALAQHFTDVLVPYPEEIGQHDLHFVLFDDSHYFPSPYATLTQKTTVRTGTSNIASVMQLSPMEIKGSKLTLGPYDNVPPFSFSHFSIHYQNSHPFAFFSEVEREIEVSHWGNVFMEDLYTLKHKGATLKDGFSRIEYQTRQRPESNTWRELSAKLPPSAWGVYYRDQIGNISTSALRQMSDHQRLEVQTRFPMFGGWQTFFHIGYNVPSEGLLSIDSTTGKYTLQTAFYVPFEDVWVGDMTVKVILPEGVKNVEVSLPFEVEEQSMSRRFTYLDTEWMGGRTVVVLKKHNLVPEHRVPLTITYDFDQNLMLVEPLLLVGTFFLFFVVSTILSRLDLSLEDKPKKA
jgi:oligosaccharyltransferase complex subunit alpha (ribophorin I)